LKLGYYPDSFQLAFSGLFRDNAENGMTPPASRSSTGTAHTRVFQNTLWGRVLLAGRTDSLQSHQAANELCGLYWYPIYAFLRRFGYEGQQAKDLTQGFFEYVLEHQLLRKANPDRGRFRSFLIGILKNYIRGEHDKEQALRRGGGAEVISIDEEVAEGRYACEPASALTPEKLLDRRWALEVLEQAMERLQTEYARSDMKDTFGELQPYLTGDGERSFADLGTRLNRTEGAARVLVHRLRVRFRQLIRAVIGDTVSDLEQVELELKHLQAALREN
jgi:RNA polymerase sigma-70 factor (ECF subfamily)